MQKEEQSVAVGEEMNTALEAEQGPMVLKEEPHEALEEQREAEPGP